VVFPSSALVVIILGSFSNCCYARCSFFVEIDLLRFLFFMVKTTFPRIRSASLRGMPRNRISTEARISFICTFLGVSYLFCYRAFVTPFKHCSTANLSRQLVSPFFKSWLITFKNPIREKSNDANLFCIFLLNYLYRSSTQRLSKFFSGVRHIFEAKIRNIINLCAPQGLNKHSPRASFLVGSWL